LLAILKLYVLTFAVFLVIDLIWLGLVARGFYQEHIGFLMKTDVNWTAAIIFYLIFIAGLLFFVLYPALDRGSWVFALLAGAFFGFITYSTYDLTNLATLKDWPLAVTLVDIAWGTVLGASVSVISFFLGNKFFQIFS